jgi:hypothetical protein
MVYDTNNENHPHLRLSVPSLRALAASMTIRPPEEMQRHIVAVAQAMQQQAEDGRVSPYWLHFEVCQTYREATIGQVAWVLMAWLQIPQR